MEHPRSSPHRQSSGILPAPANAAIELGDIVYVDIDTVGQNLEKDEVFGTVEAVKTVSDLFLPVTGEIIVFNELLDTKPEKVNSDPYGDGWMVKVEVADVSQYDELLSVDDYRNLIGA